jgi:hypothetical protein
MKHVSKGKMHKPQYSRPQTRAIGQADIEIARHVYIVSVGELEPAAQDNTQF